MCPATADRNAVAVLLLIVFSQTSKRLFTTTSLFLRTTSIRTPPLAPQTTRTLAELACDFFGTETDLIPIWELRSHWPEYNLTDSRE